MQKQTFFGKIKINISEDGEHTLFSLDNKHFLICYLAILPKIKSFICTFFSFCHAQA